MGTVEFYYHCPTEVLSSGTTTTAGLQTWLTTHELPLQATLADFLALTGRADEDVELSVSSYIASATTQSLNSLVSDITASSVALGFPIVPGQSSLFNFKGGYLRLYAGVTPTRNATPDTIHFLRHIVVGNSVILQIKGDPFTNYQRTVLAVTASSITFDAPDLPEAELLVVSVIVPDAERVNDVIVFRQFVEFHMSTTADESTFNPHLYMLLYRSISPEIVGMTATQLFQHYANAVTRIGNVTGLRASLSSPIMSDLEITNLLKISSGAAINIDGVFVRNITTFSDILAQNTDTTSDTSLLTAKATSQVLENRLAEFGSHIDTDVLNANTVNTKVVVATHEIYVPESFKATPSDVTIYVPLEVQTLKSSFVTFLEGHITTLRTENFSSDHVTTSTLESNSIRVSEMVVDLSVSTGSISTRTIEVDGSATVAGPLIAQDITISGSATANDIRTNILTVSGKSTLSDVSVSDIKVSNNVSAASIDVANGSFEVTPTGDIITRSTLNASHVESAVVAGTVGTFMEGNIKTLISDYVQTDRAKVHFADVTELSTSRVIGDLIGSGLIDAQRLVVYGQLVADKIDSSSIRTTTLDVIEELTTQNLHVLENVVCDVQLNSYRVVTDQLDVPGPALIDTLAVTGVAAVTTLHVSGDTLMAGDTTIAGTINVNLVNVSGDISASRGVFSDGVWIEWGNLVISRGNASIFGNAVVAGNVSVEGTIVTNKGLTITSGGIGCVGDLNVAGDSYINGKVTANDLYASGEVRTSDLTTFQATVLGNIELAGSLNAVGDYVTEGSVLVGGSVEAGSDIFTKGDIHIAGAAQVVGDVTIDNMLKVAGATEISGYTMMRSDLAVEADVHVTGKIDANTFSGNVIEALEGVSCDGSLTVGGGTVTRTLLVSDDTTLESHLQVQGSVNLGATLKVEGETRLCGDTIVTGLLAGEEARFSTIECDDASLAQLETQSLNCADAFTVNATVTGRTVLAETAIGGDLKIRGVIDFGDEPVVVNTNISTPLARITEAGMDTVYVRRFGITANPLTVIPIVPPTDEAQLRNRLDVLEAEIVALRALLVP